MALKTCPECGGQVSTTASSCPHCGYRETVAAIGNAAGVVAGKVSFMARLLAAMFTWRAVAALSVLLVGVAVLWGGVKYKQAQDAAAARRAAAEARLRVPEASSGKAAYKALDIEDSDEDPHDQSIVFARWLLRHQDTETLDVITDPYFTYDRAIDSSSQWRGDRVCVRAPNVAPSRRAIVTPDGDVAEGVFLGKYSRQVYVYYAIGEMNVDQLEVEDRDRVFCGYLLARESYRAKSGEKVKALRVAGSFFPKATMRLND